MCARRPQGRAPSTPTLHYSPPRACRPSEGSFIGPYHMDDKVATCSESRAKPSSTRSPSHRFSRHHPVLVPRGGQDPGNHQLPDFQARAGRSLLREDLRPDQGLGMRLREIQADQAQGRGLRPLRGGGDRGQGAPGADGASRPRRSRLPHLVPEERAQPDRQRAWPLHPAARRVIYYEDYIVVNPGPEIDLRISTLRRRDNERQSADHGLKAKQLLTETSTAPVGSATMSSRR